MKKWSLPPIMESLDKDLITRLGIVRKTMAHPGTKGDGSETIWRTLLQDYLPNRYQIEKAHVVDSNNKFSEQIDIVVFDRQYSPFIFRYEGELVIPAESVYAVFEAKQSINAKEVRYARRKIASVRNLHRTSLPIPHAGGTYPAKVPDPIIGGILTLDSDWNPPLGKSLIKSLNNDNTNNRLDLGCVAAHGYFDYDKPNDRYNCHDEQMPVTGFLFELIKRLQHCGTVPMIDIKAYAKWLGATP